MKYLVAWMNPNQGWRDADRGYVLGSYFGVRCGKDRRKHFAALSEAKDPFVRVAGAVYLCFEDATAGTAALKRMTAVDGDPGVWAALTLASAVTRTLCLAPSRCSGGLRRGRGRRKPRWRQSHTATCRNGCSFCSRTQLMLSGAPRPEQTMNAANSFESLLTWWKTHGDKLVLDDPWLPILEKQKVD